MTPGVPFILKYFYMNSEFYKQGPSFKSKPYNFIKI